MNDEVQSGSGAQREFDNQRDNQAVEKMKEWEKGEDPLLKGLGGEPWWRGWVKKARKKRRMRQQARKNKVCDILKK